MLSVKNNVIDDVAIIFLANFVVTNKRSFDIMQNKTEYRTLLVSKSLPI